MFWGGSWLRRAQCPCKDCKATFVSTGGRKQDWYFSTLNRTDEPSGPHGSVFAFSKSTHFYNFHLKVSESWLESSWTFHKTPWVVKNFRPEACKPWGPQSSTCLGVAFCYFFFWESQDFVFCDLIHWLFWDGVKIFERSSCVAIICPVPLDVCLEFYDRAAVAWVVPGALPDLVDSRSLSSASRGWFWRVRDSLLGGIISRRAVQCSGLWLWYGVLYERNS